MQEMIQFVLAEIRGAWRFRWSALGIAWAVCILGWLYIYTMSDIYQARSQVFVDADSRLVEVMGRVGVAPTPGATVFVVRQAMLARPQLENVAHDTGLDKRAKTDEEYDHLILDLKESITIEQGRFADSRNLYTISYLDRDPVMAVSVVNRLLDRFVTDVLERNDQGSQQATDYLDDQLTYYGNLLSEVEKQLAEFKKRNLGLLPGDSGGIFERLQIEMDLLKKLRLDLRIEMDRRYALREQLRSEQPNLPDGTRIPGSTTEVTGSPTENTIRELEATRANLLLSYTERHPDVVAVNEQLEQLYEQRRLEMEALSGDGSGIEGVANASNPVYQRVQIALNDSSVRIASLQSEIAQHEGVVTELNGQINTIPDVEAEFAQLNRDYDQYRMLYNRLLEQKERERMGEAGEDREVVSFNIIEPPAALPDPVAPPRTILMALVLLMGLGIGGGVAYLRHLSHPVFTDTKALRKVTGRPVLGAVSLAWTKETLLRQRMNIVTFFGVAGLLLVVFVASVVFTDYGVTAMQWVTSKSG